MPKALQYQETKRYVQSSVDPGNHRESLSPPKLLADKMQCAAVTYLGEQIFESQISRYLQVRPDWHQLAWNASPGQEIQSLKGGCRHCLG